MSIFGDMTDALIMEDEALAPFMSYCEGTEELFKRMEVIDEKSELNEDVIRVLASVFACNYNDCFNEYYSDEFEALDIAFEAVRSLFRDGEIVGSYIYLLLCCSMIECSSPYELRWIAQREDALFMYIEKFIEAMEQYEVVVEAEK